MLREPDVAKPERLRSLGLLDGPGTWFDEPMGDFGATLHVDDAGPALLAALSLPSGIYNVCRDGERISNGRFKAATAWRPAYPRA